LSPEEILASPLYFEIAKWAAVTRCSVELPIPMGRRCIKMQKESVQKIPLEVPTLPQQLLLNLNLLSYLSLELLSVVPRLNHLSTLQTFRLLYSRDRQRTRHQRWVELK
ncbi:MAG: hypothetical protein EZS28_047513, partial [Streblomastix strix]